MTIASTYAPQQYIGNGVTTIFAFPFEFYNSTDLIVKSTVIATGVTTTLVNPTDYSVTGGSGSTGNVVMVAAPASTIRLTIERSIPYTQPADYQENTAFPAETLETSLDKAVVMAQQTKSLTDYALKFETTDPSASIGTIPNSVARANALLSFDALGKPAAVTLASIGGSINVSLASPQNGDALTYNSGSWVNRSTLASLGTNIASAGTTAISAADSDFITVTGTTGITSFGTPAAFARKHIWIVFSGILTLTHNATSLILEGATNITTAAGDTAECIHISGANWRVVNYKRASGQPLIDKTMAANTVKVNATAGAAVPTDLALASGQFPIRDTAGNIAAGTFGAGLTVSGTTVTATAGPTLMTPQASTSGTAIDFTGIPSTAKRVTINFDSVSTNASVQIAVQIGDSGGIEASGYNGSGSSGASGSSGLLPSTQFIFAFGASAAILCSGSMVLTLMNSSTNTWVASSSVGYSDASLSTVSGGSKSLSSTLDRVRIKTINGTDTFDAGTINVMYE